MIPNSMAAAICGIFCVALKLAYFLSFVLKHSNVSKWCCYKY